MKGMMMGGMSLFMSMMMLSGKFGKGGGPWQNGGGGGGGGMFFSIFFSYSLVQFSVYRIYRCKSVL